MQCFGMSIWFWPIIQWISGLNDIISSLYSSTQSSLSKCLFKATQNAPNSADATALKFRLVQYDTFYNGQIQENSSMLC